MSILHKVFNEGFIMSIIPIASLNLEHGGLLCFCFGLCVCRLSLKVERVCRHTGAGEFFKEYKIPVKSLCSINAYQQKWLTCDTFCHRRHIYEKFHRGNCSLCGEFVTELSILQSQIVKSPKVPHLHLIYLLMYMYIL